MMKQYAVYYLTAICELETFFLESDTKVKAREGFKSLSKALSYNGDAPFGLTGCRVVEVVDVVNDEPKKLSAASAAKVAKRQAKYAQRQIDLSIMEAIKDAKKEARENTGSGNDYVFVGNGWDTAYIEEHGLTRDPTNSGHDFGSGPITIGVLRNAVSNPDAEGRMVLIEGRYDSAESFYAYTDPRSPYNGDYEVGEYWSVDIGIGNPEGKLGIREEEVS